jgi:phosphotransacetylase
MTAVAQVVATGAHVDVVGDVTLVSGLASKMGVDPDLLGIHSASDAAEAVELAARLVREGDAAFVVKGSLSTAELLGGLLRQRLPGRSSCASHAYVMHLEAFGRRTVILTDAGVNIAPTLETKVAIIDNAAALFRSLARTDQRVAVPRVALLSAVEKVNPKLASTVDAAALRVMWERGQINDVLIDGPMPLDAALFPHSAAEKGLEGVVAGQSDILVAPDLDAGNLLAKALIGQHTPAMGVVLGVGVPVALPSRGDTVDTRLRSFFLAAHLAETNQLELERTW